MPTPSETVLLDETQNGTVPVIPIEKRVRDIVLDSLLVEDPSTVTPEASIVGDLGASSFDCVELTIDLEQAFGFEISDEEAAEIVVVQNIIDLVKAKTLGKKTRSASTSE
jgi:acyl carrier protein